MTQGRCFKLRGFQLRFSETSFMRVKKGIDLLQQSKCQQLRFRASNTRNWVADGHTLPERTVLEEVSRHSESEQRRGDCDNRIGNEGVLVAHHLEICDIFLVVYSIDTGSPKSAVPC